jgi:UDPglucose 6-dehydrogenase
MKIGVVGYGYVGKATAGYFERGHDVHLFDKYLPDHSADHNKDRINSCDLVFISVPTPTASDGSSCDLSAIEDVFGWLRAPTCIKSTIPPGTVDRLERTSHAPIAFSPEYIGESRNHPWGELESCGFVIIGGSPKIMELVRSAYEQVCHGQIEYYLTSARTAELCKYMENCFLATKVAFVNQFFDLAEVFHVDFAELRRLWLLDSRISPSHTEVTPERGFGGKCLPKDMRAIIAASTKLRSDAPLLTAVLDYNDSVRAGEHLKDMVRSR